MENSDESSSDDKADVENDIKDGGDDVLMIMFAANEALSRVYRRCLKVEG